MSEIYELEFVHTTEAACLFRDCKGEEMWLPRSQITTDSDVDSAWESEEMKVVIPDWLAKDKGLL